AGIFRGCSKPGRWPAPVRPRLTPSASAARSSPGPACPSWPAAPPVAAPPRPAPARPGPRPAGGMPCRPRTTPTRPAGHSRRTPPRRRRRSIEDDGIGVPGQASRRLVGTVVVQADVVLVLLLQRPQQPHVNAPLMLPDGTHERYRLPAIAERGEV